MINDKIRLRSEFINTQVITRSSGKRLGVVKEVFVDIDSREIVALGLRDNRLSLSGLPRYMYLNSIKQSSDVVLVEDEDAIEDISVEVYSQLINSEVITENGEPLGRVRDFLFNLEDGRVSSLIIASFGLPQIPDRVISTYELSIDEVVSGGPNRLIVFEGAEERLTQLTVGVLESLGIGRPPWEKEEEEMYGSRPVDSGNQLPARIPVNTPISTPAKEPVPVENWSDDDWEETRLSAPAPKQSESIRYQEDEYDDYIEEDNWSTTPREQSREQPVTRYQPSEED